MVVWMAYATLLTAALAITGIAAEQLALVVAAPRRLGWALTLIIAAAAPGAVALRHASPVQPLAPPVPAPSLERGGSQAGQGLIVRPGVARPPVVASTTVSIRARAVLRRIAPYAARLWFLASAIVAVKLLVAAFSLRRRSRAWPRRVVDGVPVLVARDTGPAVMGTFAPRVVLPEWALTLDSAKRFLVLRHELEHVRARDPVLLRAASVALVLFPWNVPLWFVVRRLRQAVEIDCDQRVLAGADPETSFEYGLLLLMVGARRGASAPVAAFAGSPPFLERRIKAIAVPSGRPRLISAGAIAVVVVCSVAAARLPTPDPLIVPRPTSRPRITSPVRRPPIPTPVIPDSVAVAEAPIRPPVARPRTARSSRVQIAAVNPAPTLPAVIIDQVRIEPMPPQAPQPNRVATGTVVDAATGRTLPRVYISVVGVQAIGEPNWTCSDATGSFRLRVPNGEAWLSAQDAGHTYDNVILSPTDSVAAFRGKVVAWADSSTASAPLIIVDGLPVRPRVGTVMHLRTNSGAVLDVRLPRGEPRPQIFIDGQEVSWIAFGGGFVNPCER